MRLNGKNGTVTRFLLAVVPGRRGWGAVVACLLPCVATGGEVDDLKAAYSREVVRLGDSRVASLLDLAGQYTASLAALQARMQSQGNLDGWQAVDAEKRRFEQDRRVSPGSVVTNVPDLARLQDAFVVGRQGIDLRHARNWTSLADRYQARLEQSVSDLTKRGQIDDAVAAKGALDALVADPELAAARELLQSAGTTDEPAGEPDAGGAVTLGNVALASRGAVARCPSQPGEMIDGNSTRYTGSSGYASGVVPAVFEVEFPKVMRLRQIRFLLWDGDSRAYAYKIELSPDGEHWSMLKDASRERCRSWQEFSFLPKPVRIIRITGLSNTANANFHIVEVEAYCTLGLKVPPRRP